MLGACGGGGGGGSGGGSGGTTPTNVTISGTITYDYVPVATPPQTGLDYNAIQARPARLVTVQFVQGTTVLATTKTDTNGDYSLTVPANRTGFVRARAESVQAGTPGWDVRVVDNTSSDAIYTLDGSASSSGSSNGTRNLRAASGWGGSSYTDPRAAAPFAILDTIYDGLQYLSAAQPTSLPAFVVHWSPDNVAALDDNGDVDPSTGKIGTSYFGSNGMYILGKEDDDTDEYDRSIILHELGHYLERQLGRSDSIGGPHTRGDRLDLRVAYSEGLATAFAQLALGDPRYVDTGGLGQAGSFSYSVESRPSPNPAPGWYSEESVQGLIYDLVDDNVDGPDILSYPLTDFIAAESGAIVDSRALASIFPFLNAIKTEHPGDAATIDQLAADQDIAPVSDDFGSNETNDAGLADVLPIYPALTVDGPAVNVCSTDKFTSVSGAVNKLGSRRFIKFRPQNAGAVSIEVKATNIPQDHYADPDWIVHNASLVILSDGPPTDACKDFTNPAWVPGECVEPDPANGSPLVPVNAEDYVLEVYEWTNTNDTTDADYPPIGPTCFEVRVTQQ